MEQHVAHHRGEIRALVPGEHRAARRASRHLRRRQPDAARLRQRPEHLARIVRRPPHRQPAAAAPAHRLGRQRPDLRAAVEAVAQRRPAAAHHRPDARDGRVVPHPRRAQPDPRGAAARPPGEEHPVEVQVQARDRRVVARIRRLARLDLGQPRQRARRDHEAPRNAGHAGRSQRRRQIAERVGVEHRVARARQHQIAAHHAALDRPRGDHPRGEPVARPQHLQRPERGQDLHHRGRRLVHVRLVRLQHPPGGRVADRESGARPQPRPLEDRGQRHRLGRGPGRAQRQRGQPQPQPGQHGAAVQALGR
jgi:hypothetical protein